MNFRVLLLLGLLMGGTIPAARAASSGASRWEQSIVTLDITRQQYDYFQPWSKRPKSVQKNGILIGPNEILTTADELSDRTLVRAQRSGRGKWWTVEVTWVDYHANLALITCGDKTLWTGMRPVDLAEKMPSTLNDVQLVRWRNGNLETRKMEFNQYTVDDAKLSYAACIQMEFSSEVNGAGWSEPVVAGNKVIGLMVSQNGNTCRALPAPFVRSILEAHKKGTYHGLGYFAFVWGPAENPDTLKFLKLPGDPRGVIISDIPKREANGPLKKRDMILQVEGYDIDVEGYYNDPDYGHLSLEGLSTRKKWAGDSVKLKILRDGAESTVTYTLPKVDYNTKLVPDHVFDREPEYLIAGGLVFQPLTDELLRGWGEDWRRRAPFRLSYYNNEDPTPQRPALVLLTTVLPDAFNIGYHDYRYLVVDSVNGQKISRLGQLHEALSKPVNGFHTIQFVKGDSTQRVVLDASDLDRATKRVLQRFGIGKAEVLDQSPAGN
ncbi:MAG TPA: hypothetical protein VHH73_17570 [Verrucomicrobiae bacterium]|nr:hypothetical protein [Verrucomicrobiae bacterium]